MLNKYIISIFATALFVIPSVGLALEMPKSGSELAEMSGINARSYIVENSQTGEVLISKNPNLPWTPASLTKLLTLLVVLDAKPKLKKIVTINSLDQSLGACGSGGACIKARAGIKFTVDGLIHAALMPSANNAAGALARSTGLSPAAFAEKMNQKAQSLGASSSYFNEPTGLDPSNITTAGDYAKIVTAAFHNPYLRKIAALDKYLLRSSNNSKYNQTIKNTNKLLGDADVTILGAKTGYLNESNYNFASLISYRGGQELAVVVLGEDHLYTAFEETKQLAKMAEDAKAIAFMNQFSTVLGTSTAVTINYSN